jgi:hypothetical protein
MKDRYFCKTACYSKWVEPEYVGKYWIIVETNSNDKFIKECGLLGKEIDKFFNIDIQSIVIKHNGIYSDYKECYHFENEQDAKECSKKVNSILNQNITFKEFEKFYRKNIQ